MRGTPAKARVEATKMTPPRPCRRIDRPKWCVRISGARPLTCSSASSGPRSLSRNLPVVALPALFTSRPTGTSAVARSTAGRKSSWERSTETTRVLTECRLRRSSASARSRSSRRATSTRFRPISARRRAKASPIPDEAPVTSAQGPNRSIKFFMVASCPPGSTSLASEADGSGRSSFRPGGLAFDLLSVERAALDHAVGPVLEAEEVQRGVRVVPPGPCRRRAEAQDRAFRHVEALAVHEELAPAPDDDIDLVVLPVLVQERHPLAGRDHVQRHLQARRPQQVPQEQLALGRHRDIGR